MAKRRKSDTDQAASKHKKSRSPTDAQAGAGPRAAEKRDQPGFPIVGVGASAGGIEALRHLFGALPDEPGMAFVVIQHLDPTRPSLTPELIGKHTAMRVYEVADEPDVAPNRVYVIPPGKYLSISGGTLELSEPDRPRGSRMAIDFFLRSLAADQAKCAIGIILSGTGTDGTLGVKAIKAQGGLVIAQAPDEADYPGMPTSAIATGAVDHVLPIHKIADALVSYSRHSYVQLPDDDHLAVQEGRSDLNAILTLLSSRTKYDFHCYKSGTLLRRTRRRMGLRHFHELREYLEFLRGSLDEIDALVSDLLISVTDFFREPEAWQTLEEQIIAPLVARRHPDEPIRVWVPGCATGEEPYSVAILILEQLHKAGRRCPLQVFASDIDKNALEKARIGRYPSSIAADVSAERLNRFFIEQEEDHHYQVSKTLRESVVFADQNLISDPPFSKIDLICCRNVLIYLRAEVQQKLISLFHFALAEGGALFLGSSETIGRGEGLFQPVSQKHRIYRRMGGVRHERLEFPVAGRHRREFEPVPPGPPRRESRLANLAQQRLLEWVAPAAVLIDIQWQIHYFCGATDLYLTHTPGTPTQDLLAKSRPGLRTKLRGAVQHALEKGETVTTAARVKRDRRFHAVQITAQPVRDAGQDGQYVLVMFQDEEVESHHESDEADPATTRKSRKSPRADADAFDAEDVIRHLEDELSAVKEDLSSTIEQFETSNEEYKAANEEVTSINEELQSTNEELETSKEELQSLNEELTTVNFQLATKVDELEARNNDLSNLLASTDIATICLDRSLTIKWFTPATTQLMNLVPSDIGRPLSDFSHKFANEGLYQDAERVLDRLVPLKKEIDTKDARTFLRRMAPYRTSDDRIEGVVVTFVDITDRKRFEASLRESKEIAERIIAAMPTPKLVVDDRFCVVSVNEAYCELFQVAARQTEGRSLWELGHHQWDVTPLRELLEDLFSSQHGFNNFEVEKSFDDIGQRTMRVHARPIDGLRLAVLVIQDITQDQRDEQMVQFLADASVALAELQDFDATLARLVDFAVPTFADWCSVYLVEAGDAVRHLASVHADPTGQRITETIRERYPPTLMTPRGVVYVARTGKPEIVSEVSGSFLADIAIDEEHLRLLRLLEIGSYICVPVQVRGRTAAVLCFVLSESGRRYTNHDLAIAEELARRTSIAAVNAQLYQQLRDADRRKDEFLAMLAHELRNPLAPLRLGLSVLQPGEADQQKLVLRMQGQIEHLSRMVDDLLDVSRITRGKIRLRAAPVALADVVERAVDSIRPLADSSGQTLAVRLPERPLWVAGDDVRLVQVVQNLLSNAVKFSDQGGQVEVALTSQEDGAVIEVRDSGIGIDGELLPRVFDLFTPSSQTFDRSQGGLGIGLTLVKYLVEMHGGSVSGKSEGRGQGSVFTVRLPLGEAPAQAAASRKQSDASQHRILVVDDNVDAARTLAMLFEQLSGSEVQVAFDGSTALGLVDTFQPEIVVLDIGLPGMDGYEVARRLRQSDFTGLVVAVTDCGHADDFQKSRDAGFDEHLVKPPDVNALEALLRHPKLSAAGEV